MPKQGALAVIVLCIVAAAGLLPLFSLGSLLALFGL